MEHDAVMQLIIEKYIPLAFSGRLTNRDYHEFFDLVNSAEEPVEG